MGGGSLRPPPAGRPVLFPATRPVPGRPERSDHQSAANPLRGRAADLRLALLHRLVGLRLVLLPAADPQRLTRLRVLHLDALATQALHELRLAVHVVTGLLPVALTLRRVLLARLLGRLDLAGVVGVAEDLDRLPG